ncbi:TPA: ferredoxin [Candidatus Sumerlaeota bacterium]|jgi:(2Fe-2S) ferredoxin|nr:ferredoxin [Candidatus Sumerlaeota bacterium]
MDMPDYHFFVCASFRVSGEAQGVCNKKGAVGLIQHLESEISDRDLNAVVSSTGCLKMCTKGPVMMLYPQGLTFGEVTEDKIDEIMDAIEEGGDLAALAL